MSVKLKVALLGCGVITQRTLPGLIAVLNERHGRISALCDLVASNRRAVAGACGNSEAREYSDLRLMLGETDCNVVFVATPVGLHFEHARQALQAGRHVYCHKTLADSPDKCDFLAAMAETKGLRLAASPGQTLLPAYARAREIVEAGELGDLVSVDAGTEAAPHRHESERARETAQTHARFSWEWYHRRGMGGGPLDDMFVYPLAFLTQLMGDVTRAAARGRLVTPRIKWKGAVVEADALDSYAGILEFGEVSATFRASFSANARKTPWGTICIRGTNGCLEIEKRNDLSYRLYITPNNASARIEYHEAFDSEDSCRYGSVECHVLTDMAEHLSACLEERPVRGATARNAARVASGLSLIRKSADQDGAWVSAGSLAEGQ